MRAPQVFAHMGGIPGGVAGETIRLSAGRPTWTGEGWAVVHQQVQVIGLAVELARAGTHTSAHRVHEVFAAGEHRVGKRAAGRADEHPVRVQGVDGAAGAAHVQVEVGEWHGGDGSDRY